MLKLMQLRRHVHLYLEPIWIERVNLNMLLVLVGRFSNLNYDFVNLRSYTYLNL